ncbi:hypothetical protein, partial [Amycolatopsis sp. NPDC000740]|uniref:hypothetical protein n=1 Tax=Amycolatopsis sp. NPDC000740 TaxID=3154269 RepID=UPI00331D2F01
MIIGVISVGCLADGFGATLAVLADLVPDLVAASCIAASSGPAISHSDNRAIANPAADNSPLDDPVTGRIGNPAVSTGPATRRDPVTDGIANPAISSGPVHTPAT